MASSGLETLPTEVFLHILTYIPSVHTLQSLLFASPLAARCYSPNRTDLLRQVLLNELGPVLRDAVFAAHLDRDPPQVVDIDQLLDAELAAAYKHLLYDLTPAELLQLVTDDVAVHIACHVQLLQRFLDVITEPLLANLAEIDARAAKPLSDTERRRFLQALVRYSIVLHLERRRPQERMQYGMQLLPPPRRAVRGWGLFRAWELQQVADCDAFIGKLFRMLPLDRADYVLYTRTCAFLADVEYARRTAMCGSCGRFAEMPVVRPARVGQLHDLPTLWQRMGELMALAPHFEAHMVKALRNGNMLEGVVHALMGNWNDCTDREADAPWPPPPPCGLWDEEEEEEGEGEEATTRPPYAWRDAQRGEERGEERMRWGDTLVLVSRRRQPHLKEQEARWRSFGFAFWDEARVRVLKEVAIFAEFATGWVTEAEAARYRAVAEATRRRMAAEAASHV